MKAYSADLVAMLASKVPMWKADLYKIGPLLNGQMIYATNGGSPITYLGNTYQPSQYGMWSRDSITVKVGLDSNSTRLTVLCDTRIPVYFPGTSQTALMLDGVKYGLLGQANVSIFTSYCPQSGPWGVTAGPTGGGLVETKFVGMCANVEYIGMTKATIVVQDMLYLLNLQAPRKILQASCWNVLYDAQCSFCPTGGTALTAASHTRTGAVGAVINSYSFAPASNLVLISAAGTFTQGTLTFTSGQNLGISYFVRQWTPGGVADTIQLDVAPILPLHVGDSFKITEGCSKTFVSCLNLQPTVIGGVAQAYYNFGGQPFVPVPETAL